MPERPPLLLPPCNGPSIQPLGEDEAEQLLCIMEVLGAPPRRLVDASARRKAFFDNRGLPLVKANSRGAPVLPVVCYCGNACLDAPRPCAKWRATVLPCMRSGHHPVRTPPARRRQGAAARDQDAVQRAALQRPRVPGPHGGLLEVGLGPRGVGKGCFLQ